MGVGRNIPSSLSPSLNSQPGRGSTFYLQRQCFIVQNNSQFSLPSERVLNDKPKRVPDPSSPLTRGQTEGMRMSLDDLKKVNEFLIQQSMCYSGEALNFTFFLQILAHHREKQSNNSRSKLASV